MAGRGGAMRLTKLRLAPEPKPTPTLQPLLTALTSRVVCEMIDRALRRKMQLEGLEGIGKASVAVADELGKSNTQVYRWRTAFKCRGDPTNHTMIRADAFLAFMRSCHYEVVFRPLDE